MDGEVKACGHYVTKSGTHYDARTNSEVIRHLERLRDSGLRIRIRLGDAETGRDWQEEYDVTGRVGRSTGTCKIPLLVHNARSRGGGGILTHCIVGIECANKRDGGVIWQHDHYHK